MTAHSELSADLREGEGDEDDRSSRCPRPGRGRARSVARDSSQTREWEAATSLRESGTLKYRPGSRNASALSRMPVPSLRISSRSATAIHYEALIDEGVMRKVKNKKILIVEDEPAVRKLCEVILRHHSFDSITTTNGQEGLDAYQERHEEICLVLSDVTMPVMSGIEMTRKLFEIHSHQNVILMSGRNLSELVPADVRRLCSIIEKPFTSASLLSAVKKCLNYEAEQTRHSAFSD